MLSICNAIHSPFYSHLNESFQLALCQTGGAPDSTMAITNVTTVDKQSLFILNRPWRQDWHYGKMANLLWRNYIFELQQYMQCLSILATTGQDEIENYQLPAWKLLP